MSFILQNQYSEECVVHTPPSNSPLVHASIASRSHNPSSMDKSGSQASIGSKPKSTTTYVQTDSTNFRDIVQRLTGVAPAPAPTPRGNEKGKEQLGVPAPPTNSNKIVINLSEGSSLSTKGRQTAAGGLKLHERRQYTTKPTLQIPRPTPPVDCTTQLQQDISTVLTLHSPSANLYSTPRQHSWNSSLLKSPLSNAASMSSPHKRGSAASSSAYSKGTGDVLSANNSVKERRLFMNSSPRSNERRDDQPELLTLFPLTSPKSTMP